MLTTNTDEMIISLKGGLINNIEGPLEVLQKFTVEQVIKYVLFKIKFKEVK